MQSEFSTAGADRDLSRRVEELERELSEAHRREAATADVLRVISRSTFDLQSVFDTLAENAVRLCEAERAFIFRFDGRVLRAVSTQNVSAELKAFVERNPITPGTHSASARAALDRRTVHIEDIQTEPGYTYGVMHVDPIRTVLAIPILRAGELLGVIVIYRDEVRPFSDGQIALMETFADQAVIAIENTRLFEAEQMRTRELQESLEHQTAIAEVLGAISHAPTDAQPVFDIIAASARRLCGAGYGQVALYDGELLHMTAFDNVSPEGVEALRRRFPAVADRGSAMGRAIHARAVVQIPDVVVDPAYAFKSELQTMGFRSLLVVPMLGKGGPIGAIAVGRPQRGPFSDNEIELLRTFADQAVIAIENRRLFEAEQASKRELQESLEYQTATSDVLNVISRSPTDVQPVFDMIAQSSARLCEAQFCFVYRFDGQLLHFVAHHGNSAEGVELLRRAFPAPPNRGTAASRAVLDRSVVSIPDITADPDFTLGEAAMVAGYRGAVAVPMLRDGLPIGSIAVARSQAGFLPDRQIELLKTFADQAVIAIENARLFEEVQARTRELSRSVAELRALGEVGQTVSSTLDLSKVLQTVVEQACTMSYASGGAIYVYDKVRAEFHLEAGHKMSEEHIARVSSQPIHLGDAVVGECAVRRQSVQVEDLRTVPATPLLDILLRVGVRAILAVPLLHQGEVIGALAVRRNQPGGFSADIVNLLEVFAAQSAIAVHNARLFKDVEDASRALELASQHKSQFVANMSHELRTPLAAILGYAELMQEGFYGALPGKSMASLTRIRSNGKHLLGLINSVLDIAKIEAGQFSLSLAEYALDSVVETVRVATESLAETKKLVLKTDVGSRLPIGLGDEQRLTQVLLNLVGNAIKFTDTGEVRITATTMNGHFTVAVTDTGPGIPPEELKRVFEQFHQIDNSSTRTKGGTGLGLAIAKQIVEMHGGRIWVELILGKGATFQMELPVRAEDRKGAA